MKTSHDDSALGGLWSTGDSSGIPQKSSSISLLFYPGGGKGEMVPVKVYGIAWDTKVIMKGYLFSPHCLWDISNSTS